MLWAVSREMIICSIYFFPRKQEKNRNQHLGINSGLSLWGIYPLIEQSSGQWYKCDIYEGRIFKGPMGNKIFTCFNMKIIDIFSCFIEQWISVGECRWKCCLRNTIRMPFYLLVLMSWLQIFDSQMVIWKSFYDGMMGNYSVKVSFF